MTTIAVKKVLSRITKIETELSLLKKSILETTTDNNDWTDTSKGKRFLSERIKIVKKEILEGNAVTSHELRKELGL